MKTFLSLSPGKVASVALLGMTYSSFAHADASLTLSEDAPSAWEPYDGAEIKFDVFRKGDKKFGSHVVAFDVADDGSFTANTEVSLRAGLGPITVFRYTLESQERWENNQLIGLEAATNDDGEKERVLVEMNGGSLAVDGSGYEGTAPAGIIPSSHWNIREVFSSQILSTESGELLDVEVTKIGEERLDVAGQAIDATHYRLVSDLTVDLWYDDQGRWVQLSFEARGQTIDYRLAEIY